MLGFILAGFVSKSFPIGKGLRFSYVIAGTGGFCYMVLGKENLLFKESPAMLPILICMSRIGTTMGFNIGYISVPRLFPTRFVATVYGITNLVAHSFACLAPMVAEIKDPFPFSIFLIGILISLCCTYHLIELDSKITSIYNEDPDTDSEIVFLSPD